MPARDLRVRLADHERARDVGEAAGRAVLRPEVDDHGLAGRDRPAAGAVAARGRRAVGDGVLAERDVRALDRVAHDRGQALAGQVELAVAHGGIAQRFGGRREPLLRRAGGAADAGQLGLALAPPAALEQRTVDVQLDPCRAQRLGGLERELRRHRGALDAELAARAHADLEQRLVPRLAGREQLAQAKVAEHVELLQVRPRGGDHVRVQRRDRRERDAVALAVEEGVQHGHGDLVAQFGGADRVRIDQDVDHAGTVAKRVTVATSAHAPAVPASDEDGARPGVLGQRPGGGGATPRRRRRPRWPATRTPR